MKSQLPPRHPPVPPIRISLNLDEIPLDQSPTFPSLQQKQSISLTRLDLALTSCFMKSQFKRKNIIQSNFASAFVSQQQIMPQQEVIEVPKINTHQRPIQVFSKKVLLNTNKRKQQKVFLRRNK